MSKGVAAVLLVVGLALGFVLGRMSAPDAIEPPAVDPDAPSGERPSVAPPTAPAPVAAPTLAASGDSVTEAFRAAYERLPAPAQVRGDGVITGTVRSDTGEPIAGAVVTAVRRDAPLPAAAQDPKRGSLDPAEQLRVRAEWIAWREAGRYRTTSAPDGTWRIEGLPDFAFQVEGSATGWTLKVRGDVARESRAGDTVKLVGVPLVSLTLDVRRDGGGSPPNAMIGLRSRQSSASRTWTPSQPAFDLEPGSYDVVATTDDGAPQSSEHVEVLVERGPPTTVVLQMRARPALRLRVKWPDGEHYPHATASVVRHEGRELPDAAAMDDLADDGYMVRLTSGDGPRLIRDLEPGRYLVVVRRSKGAGIGGHAIVEVGSGLTECEVVVPPVDRSQYVVVRVTGPGGVMLPDAELSGSGSSPTWSWSGPGDTMARSDGTAWFFPGTDAPLDAPEMRWTIHATHPLYGDRSVEVPRGTARDVTIRMDEPARLEVVLLPGEGSPPLGDLTVMWSDGAGSDPVQASRSAQAVGSAERVAFPRLQPTNGAVAVYHAGAGRRGSPSLVHRVPVTLRSGPQTVEIRLPRLHAITFRGAPGLTVHLVRDGDSTWSRTVELGRSGTTVVGPMPDGVYKAVGMLKSTTFTLPGATEVDLR